MSDDQNGPTGPDLTTGIPAADLADGTMLGGHAGDDAVLVARVGEKLFAVAATCTHYGGPLAEGLLVGETVRCPWHHACFDLRTGFVERCPALRPLARWEVRRDGDRIVVGRKIEPADPELGGSAAPISSIASAAPATIVIIGAGAAGSAAADTLRREGFGGRVIVIDGDRDAPYDRPNLSKDYLAGNAPEEWIPLRAQEAYTSRGIELRLGVRARRIDVAAKRVELDDGSSVAYDRLLIATGASPARLPGAAGESPRVMYLRTLADCRAIIAAEMDARRAGGIVASFIGLEVHVVGPEQRPLERVLGPQLGDFVRSIHESHGVTFHLGRTVRSIAETSLTLDDGTTLGADLVVAGVGVRPNLELAATAGVVEGRGIAVDERLETKVPGIFAAGDLAYWPDPHSGERIHVEHWVVAERMGQVAARNMLGAGERFDAVPFFWSAHYDVQISYVGHAESWDVIEISGDVASRDFAARYVKGDRVLAVVTVGRDGESLESELAMERAIAR
jgi:NADPH-dependent 2,4-dienoyl-CoA reductase/sulfur reductase-like enzyme/nitrite reductase/ring-hydroxylating ferredoxin subunit